jgi:peptide deformylase
VPLRPIRLLGDPVLTTPAAPVTTFDKELRVLVQDLADTMLDAPGAGLAAPQIGVQLRVFTYHVDGELGHLVNPDLTLTAEEQDGPEGCLSIPGVVVDTPRAWGVVARGWSMYGEPIVIEGTARKSRAIQHETDHLDGVLFIDRLDEERRREAIRQIRLAQEAGEVPPDVRISPHRTSPRAEQGRW